jgi:protocatechuate 3,4-dioxygenase beta subunit
VTKLFSVLTLIAACANAQSVEGIVINSGTGRGIAGVQVRIVPASIEKSYFATTDANGHFLVEGLKPGTYAFGYQLSDYSPSGPMFPQVFQVAAAGNTVKLEGRMMPFPKISGRVVDGRGDAVANAKLELSLCGGGIQDYGVAGQRTLRY